MTQRREGARAKPTTKIIYMLKNYFKIAIAVLKRRKFFTFISLFGISFTLTIIMVATAFFDNLMSPGYPDVHRDRNLYVTTILQTSTKGSINGGEPSYYFFKQFASTLKVPEKLALVSRANFTNTYINNKKLSLQIKYTNAAYWEVLQYEFLEGKPYTRKEIDNAEKMAVISDDTRDDYFGEGVPAVGKYIEVDNAAYRVIGVVRGEPATNMYTGADIFLPYTLSKVSLDAKELNGSFNGILQARSTAELGKMSSEFDQMFAKVPILDKEYDHKYMRADSYLASFTSGLAMSDHTNSNGLTSFYAITGIIVFLFMLLPTMNLVNINITRIMERSSEIGVRKAFGASSRALVYQFLVENIILTLLGGLIGVLLSIIALQILNSAHLIRHLTLHLDWRVLSYSLLACLFFGLLSGIYPAWRMSKLNVVTALKAG
jgi:putative ABC transport system permease protein